MIMENNTVVASSTIAARMQKTVEALSANLAKIRSGRAHVGLLDSVSVNCYGADMPLSQLATVSVADSRVLLISVWDRQNVAAVEKAVRESALGVQPIAAGETIRAVLPSLSEERRRELVKVVGKEAEDARVAVRNIRRDALSAIKAAVKNKDIGEDEGRRLEQQAQKTTDGAMEQIESVVDKKQKELMAV